MDTETYIASGVIEAYVMGTASHDEAAILECVMKNNAEVKTAVLEMQQTLELYATAGAVQPPADMRAEIKKKLSFSRSETMSTNERIVQNEEMKGNVLKQHNTVNWYSIAAALLLLVSVALGYQLLSVNDKTKVISEQNNNLTAKISELEQMNSVLQNSRKIQLNGVEKHPDMLAEVYWDDQNQVHLQPKRLPAAPAGKQYQLWAIVDGKPVDLGIYDDGKEEKMQTMKPVASAQAFAITLEKEGGNPTPTMEEMYVMGEI